MNNATRSTPQRCTRTVMDTGADPDIRFDADGVCNYYHDYQRAAAQTLLPEPRRTEARERLVARIKQAGKGRRYDCLIGLSGGVDSSYVAYLVHTYGLRPLAVHLDNGWNTELATANIGALVRALDIDLHTVVVDWAEFRDRQLAYLRASVVDVEVVSDHAIFAAMYRLAARHRIPYIISGSNLVTEHIMPPGWLYDKLDYANLRDIHRQYGAIPRKTYPVYRFRDHLYYAAVLRLPPVALLNYVDYRKNDAKMLLQTKFGWRDYGGKHYESLFTKFFQAYILPAKFGIDKRKPHLSTLICSGQMTRADALEALEQPLYQPDELERDRAFVLKKLGLTPAEFDELLARPPRAHGEFRSDRVWKQRWMRLLVKTAPVRRFFINHGVIASDIDR